MSDSPSIFNQRVKRCWRALRWVLLFALLGALGRYVLTHLHEFSVITEISAGMFLWLSILYAVLLVLNSLQNYIVIAGPGVEISFFTWFRISTYARLLNRFVPQAGNAYRIGELKLSHGFPVSSYIVSLSAFSILNRLFTLGYVIGVVVVYAPDLSCGGVNVAAALIGVIALAVLSLCGLRAFSRSRIGKERRSNRFLHKAEEVVDGVVQCCFNRRIVIGILCLSAISFVVSVYTNWLCFAALGAPLGFAELSVLKFIKSTADSISLTPGNVGVTEALYGVFGRGLGGSASAAILAAAILNLSAIASTIALAGLVAAVPRRTRPAAAEPESRTAEPR